MSSEQEPDLFTAVACNQADVVQKLIADGVDVNVTPTRWKVIHVACTYGCPETLKVLLAAGVDVNEPCTWLQYTPIMHAVINENKECVRILLQNGADVNCKNQYGVPFIQYVCKTWNDIALVKDVIKAGLSVHHDFEKIINVSTGAIFKEDLRELFKEVGGKSS